MSERRPDPRLAVAKYRQRAPRYDRRTRVFDTYRRLAVERLLLSPGDAVLDVACGTGLNFALIERHIGPGGRLVGIDLSPEMLASARDRVERAGWANVTLIESAVDEAELGIRADAALFSFTHDVLQSDAAVENVIGALAAGGRVASVGARWAPRWRVPVNLVVWYSSRGYVTTFEGLQRPWARLERHVPELTVESRALGGVYIASGTVRDGAP